MSRRRAGNTPPIAVKPQAGAHPPTQRALDPAATRSDRVAAPTLGDRVTLRPSDASRWGLGDAALAYMVGILASTVAVSVVIALGAETGTAVTLAAGVAGLWVGFIGGPLVASRTRGDGRPVDEFGLRVRWADVPPGVVCGMAAQLVVVPVVSWPLQRLLGGDVSESARDLLGPGGAGRWLIIAIVIVGAPVAEELFFRGLLLRGFARHLSDPVAVIASSAVFGATHFQLLQFPGLFTAGLLFATLTWRSGRLGPAIIAHVAFNATTVVVLLT